MHPTDHVIDTLDQERLMQLYKDDIEMLGDHIEMFLDEVIPNFLELDAQLVGRNWTAVTDLTHQLRPWLGMVGLTSLENKLCEIEKLAKNNPDPEMALVLWNDFQAGLKKMKLVLAGELQRIK